MANKRDVQLVIRARDEASAALAKISGLLGQLDIKQKGTSASGTALAGTLAETISQMAQLERATRLVVGASNRAEQAIERQRSAIAGTASELASVTKQLAAARSTIDKQQGRIVETLFKGGDASGQIEGIKAARAAAADLEGQEQRLTRTLAAQQGTLDQQQAGFRELAANANTAEAALASFGDEAARANLKAAAASEEASTALRQQAAAQEELNRAAQARTFFAAEAPVSINTNAAETALADLLRAEEQQEQALKRLQDRLDPLAVIEHKLAADTKLLAKAHETGKIDADQYAKSLDNLTAEANAARDAVARTGRGEKGQVAMFGLKPYELTNLGYQVNDVVTQIASGTSVMQTFAQQGGQILQLMPNIGASIIGAFRNPFILAAAAATGVFTLAIKEAADEADRLRQIEALLTVIGDASGETAKGLAEVAKQIENIGFSADDAIGLVRTFLTEGLNTDYLRDFAEAANDYATVTGKELPEAAEDLKDAFTAGYDAVAELDSAFTFLTLAEREQIRAMFESGDAAGAREKAFAIFSDRMDDIAKKSQGTWAGAVKSLDKAFQSLLTTLGESDFAGDFMEGMENLVRDLEFSFTKIEDLTADQLDKQIKAIETRQEELKFDPLYQLGQAGSDELRLDYYRKLRAEIKETERATGDLVDEEAEASRKRESDTLRQIEQENRIRDARTSAQRIALEGEKAYQAAVNEGHSQRVANARREQAIERQRREEQRREEQERKRREGEFADAISNNGRDQLLSTAGGFVGRKEGNRTDASILSEFFKAANVNIDPKMVAWCAAFVNAVLATNGLPTVDQSTGGNDLRARDFLGYGSEVTKPEAGDIVILKRGGNAAQGHVGFFKGFTDGGDVRVLGGNQSNGVNTQTYRKEDVLGFRRAPSAGDVAEQQLKAIEKQRDAQEAFNQKIDEANSARAVAVLQGEKLVSLSGEALIDEERRQAINNALLEARQEALENELTLTQEREQAIRDTVAAEFDLANARSRASAALDDASALRDAMLNRLDQAQAIGDSEGVQQAEIALGKIDDMMRQAIEKAIVFWQTVGGNTPQAQAEILNLQTQLDAIDIERRDREQRRAEAPVQQFQSQRNGLQEQIAFYSELGDTAVVEQLREQLRAVDEQLLGAIDTALAFWQTQTGPEAQAAILQFQNLRNQVLAASNEFVITAGQIQDAFAGSLIDGFRTFAEVLVETRDPLEALAQGALQFAADFTRKLAEMGLEMLAFKLASEIGFKGFAGTFSGALGAAPLTAAAASLGAAGGTVAAAGTTVTAGAAALGVSAASLAAAAQLLLVANSIGSAGVFHGGGIAGGLTNRSRAVSPMWFAAATRYHSGGVAGLRPNEVPTILERGEEILTRSDPRHRYNFSGSDSSSTRESLTQVLAIGEESIANAMKSASGRRVILTAIEENRETVRTMLDG